MHDDDSEITYLRPKMKCSYNQNTVKFHPLETQYAQKGHTFHERNPTPPLDRKKRPTPRAHLKPKHEVQNRPTQHLRRLLHYKPYDPLNHPSYRTFH